MKIKIWPFLVFGLILAWAFIIAYPILSAQGQAAPDVKSITVITNDQTSMENYYIFAGYKIWKEVPMGPIEIEALKFNWSMGVLRMFQMRTGKVFSFGLMKRAGERPWATTYFMGVPTRKYAEGLCRDIRPIGAFWVGIFVPERRFFTCTNAKKEGKRV